MRSEFLGECARFNGLAEAVNRTQYLVPRMDRDGLLRAIRRPALLYGGEVSVELAERLIADVRGREDELPLIQHGLMLMWNSAVTLTPNQPVKLDIDSFEHAGRLTQLLSDHANRVMGTASLSEKCDVEQLFRALHGHQCGRTGNSTPANPSVNSSDMRGFRRRTARDRQSLSRGRRFSAHALLSRGNRGKDGYRHQS